MIPISDSENRRGTFPVVNVAIIVLNVLVFAYEMLLQTELGARGLQNFVLAYGVIPFEITTGRDIRPLINAPVYITLLTSMFIHGGWLHIIGNMLYLWVFGDNVEDALGHVGYLFFYLACGLGGAIAFILSDPGSDVPSVGASGAIAGVLAAYVLFFPGARVNTIITLGFIFIRPIPALIVIGFWIVLQLFSAFGGTEDGVAYWAHIGGFLVGLLLALPQRGRVQQTRSYRSRWTG